MDLAHGSPLRRIAMTEKEELEIALKLMDKATNEIERLREQNAGLLAVLHKVAPFIQMNASETDCKDRALFEQVCAAIAATEDRQLPSTPEVSPPEGFYWVRCDNDWIVAYHRDGWYTLPGEQDRYVLAEISEIGPLLVPPTSSNPAET
jgi:hypothetical protein